MTATNPLLADWTTPFALPPFDRIRASDFGPAFEAAMRAQRAEVEAIATQPDAPDFENTVAAFDRSGRLLSRIEAAFHALAASHTSPDIQAVQRELAGPLAAHDSAVMMHAGLFARLDAVYAKRHALALDAEQLRLVERLHVDFMRAGARLGPDRQPRYAQIMERLAQLTTRFAQNVLADEAGFQLELSDDELDGLPPFVRAAARQAASDRGLAEGTHVVTLSRSLIVPFLTFSNRRELRERAWKAWVGRGEIEGETDNREVARDILRLRQEQAWMHGHASYADDFRQVFGADIFADVETTFLAAVFSVASFESTARELRPFTSKFDLFLHGRLKLSTQELRGFALFNRRDKGNCAGCHPSTGQADGSPPVFTDYTYDNLGVPRNPEIAANADPAYFDLGLCGPDRIDLAERRDLCGQFKVPTLRNVATRQVWFHNGYFHSLKETLHFYVERDTHPERWYPVDAAGVPDKFDDLPAPLRRSVNTQEPPYDRRPGQAPRLNDAEIDDVIAFLNTLTDGYDAATGTADPGRDVVSP